MPNTLKVAVAGAGYFARFHHDGWNRIEATSLAASADRDADKAAAAADAVGKCQSFTDVAAMLDTVRPDILDIATPPESHLGLIELAAARGIHVICQKPFCGTVEAAETACAISEAAGVGLYVHENFRFQPWHLQVKSLVDSGAIGTVYQITFRMRPGDGQGPDAYLSRQPYFQKMPRFLIHETGIHFIDVFRFLLGGEPVALSAHLRRLNPAIAGEDAGLVHLEFAGGAIAVLDGNRLVDHDAPDCRLTMGDMWVEGSAGVLQLMGDGAIRLRAKGSTTWEDIAYHWPRAGFAGDCVRATQAAISAAIRDGAPYANTGRGYLANMRIEDAAYRAHAEGRRIDLPPQA